MALVGNPNCGKTTLFNQLTGSSQSVGNWPGVTVERKEGMVRGEAVTVVDRILEQSSFFIDQPEVNAPCIDADAFDLTAFFRFDQSLFDFKKQTERIPVHCAV